MLLRTTTTVGFLLFCVGTSLQFNPDDDYYEQPNCNADVLLPAPILLGEDPSGCICREIPKVRTICFGRSGCNKLPIELNITAPVLSIVSTHVSRIVPGDLKGLSFLTHLRIEGNYQLTEISAGIFSENFTNLVNLSISFNPKLNALNEGVFDGLENLQQLFLHKNGLSNIHDITRLLQPSTLPSLLKLSLNENKFWNVSEDDFTPMENSTLEQLDLVLCQLESIHPKAFDPLKNLQALRLGENIFNSSTLTEVLKQIVKNRIPLKLLNLYSAGFRANLPKEMLEIIAISNITHLNVAKNQLVVIPSGMFPFMPNLLTLDLKENFISEIADDAFRNLPNLKSLILSNNILASIPEGALLKHLVKLNIQQISISSSKTAYFDIAPGVFSGMDDLEYLNMNLNNIPHLYRDTFEGLYNLKFLSLRNCTIYHIEKNTFCQVKNLTFLNLKNNYFISNNNPPGLYADTFDCLNSLEILLLGGNGITSISTYGNPFEKLKSLKDLRLENNFIKVLPAAEFSGLKKLEYIDLTYNLITGWNERIFTFNDKLKVLLLDHNKLTYLSQAMLEDMANLDKLSVASNSLNCDCANYKDFMKYVEIHNETEIVQVLKSTKATCQSPTILGDSVVYDLIDYFENIEEGLIDCDIDQRLVILLPIFLLLIFGVSLGSLVFYYRWHIKYWMFLVRLQLSRKGRIRPKPVKPECSYDYDAFVSYSSEDRNFVVRLVAMLENHEPYLKLCVYERDFHVGGFISDSVLRCIAKSRKTLLVVSDNYAKSQWCRWESSIAEHHRLFFENEDGEYVDDALIVIKLGPVSKNNMTPMLRYLLKTRIYLQWNADEKKQVAFWKKLRETLAPPKTEYIREITHL